MSELKRRDLSESISSTNSRRTKGVSQLALRIAHKRSAESGVCLKTKTTFVM